MALRGLSGFYTLPIGSKGTNYLPNGYDKKNMNIEVWPDEAQQFLGLPDFALMLEELRQGYCDWWEKPASEALMKSWILAIGVGRPKMQKILVPQCVVIPLKK